MAFVTADRVSDTSITAGSGAITVAGSPPSGYRTFSAVLSVGDTFYYSIQHQSLNEWEVGLGTYTSANTFSRTTIYSSSNAGSAVTFSAGTKDVFITMAAGRSLQLDASGGITPSVGSGYTRTTITATGGQTSFTASYTVNYVQVFVNGVLLNSADYTATTGTSVVLSAAASAGDIVDVVSINVLGFTGGVTITGTPSSGQLAAWTGSSSIQGIDSYPIWQAVQTGNFTAVTGNAYPVNTTSGTITVTLPASPTAGQTIILSDYAGTFNLNNVTLGRNGSNINGLASNAILSIARSSVSLVYVDSTQGWISYSAATSSPFNYSATYLVVAGGGGGGTAVGATNNGGGGGAGGILTGTYALTKGTTYSVVVGGGGAAQTAGTNSTITAFSVTAIGGGRGGYVSAASSGGSGGGGGGYSNSALGAGTSGQGFAGGSGTGTGASPAWGSGGGGGAGAVGSNGSSSAAGAGGVGVSSSITGSATFYAGGGGGGGSSVGSAGAGGNGGGGAGGGNGGNAAGTAGTTNTGGGGGGAGGNAAGGAGGSGVVILSIPTANYSGTTTGSPTITNSGPNTIIKFTASGSYTA